MAGRPSSVPRSGKGRARILLVEDDAVSLKLMRDVLRAGGYAITETMNGEDALVQAAALPVDLIVMDIGLPGMDGVETTRRLKNAAVTSRIPVVAVTAYAMPDDEARMRAAGCDAYLTKPLRFADFLAVVRSLVAASQDA